MLHRFRYNHWIKNIVSNLPGPVNNNSKHVQKKPEQVKNCLYDIFGDFGFQTKHQLFCFD